ncbi:MAG TPA: hypothetical protein VKO85_11780 [Wenzhouxiangellaceae bacterium]|nr:hypothetical protein [Wenzhouxiangellaceae bacterium]
MTCTTRTNLFSGALALAVSVTLMTGCGGDESAEQETAVSDSPQMIQREAPRRKAAVEEQPAASNDFLVVPDLEGQLTEDGLGLQTIIDASSKDAYAESLRWISQDVSPEQYQALERSLRYIKAFDSSVMGSEKRFLEAVDGKTGQEIIDRAAELVSRRN